MRSKATLAGLLQGFFTSRLIGQRRVSPHTVASYRDTFRLLLKFAQRRLKTEPSKLGLAEIDAPLLIAFLDHLEKERGNGGAAEMLGWRRSTPSSATSPCRSPSTRRRPSASWPSRPSGTRAGPSTI